MTIWGRAVFAAALLAATSGPAPADGPGPEVRSGQEADGFTPERSPPRVPVGPSPARRVTGGPGYAGSDFGLGKPAYSGIGPRPDWGRSSVD